MFAIDDFGAPPTSGLEIDAIAASILGAGLPADAERHLLQAGEAYHQDDVAETHLLAALRIAPDHPAALIGLYRFYFYKGRLLETLDVARMCLAKATPSSRGGRGSRGGDEAAGARPLGQDQRRPPHGRRGKVWSRGR